MSAPGLFMRKLPLGRAQVTGYTTPQTDFCSLVLLPLLFLSPGCGSLEPVERSWLGGLSPASSSEGTGPYHSQCCSSPCPAQAPPLRESLFQTGTAGLMLFPIQPISFPCVSGHGQMPCNFPFPIRSSTCLEVPSGFSNGHKLMQGFTCHQSCALGLPAQCATLWVTFQQHSVIGMFSCLSMPRPYVR